MITSWYWADLNGCWGPTENLKFWGYKISDQKMCSGTEFPLHFINEIFCMQIRFQRSSHTSFCPYQFHYYIRKESAFIQDTTDFRCIFVGSKQPTHSFITFSTHSGLTSQLVRRMNCFAWLKIAWPFFRHDSYRNWQKNACLKVRFEVQISRNLTLTRILESVKSVFLWDLPYWAVLWSTLQFYGWDPMNNEKNCCEKNWWNEIKRLLSYFLSYKF
jgi:hypothetical protein